MRERTIVNARTIAICFAIVLLCLFVGKEGNVFAAEEVTPAPETEEPVVLEQKPEDTVTAPDKVKSLKVTSRKINKAVLKWRKTAAKGLIVMYSRNSSFSKAGKIKLKGSKTSVTISGLKSGKRYYFRVRAYNQKKKIVKYGAWSETKSVVIHFHKYVKQDYCPVKLSTGTAIMYKCSCGKAYYKTKASNGKTYDGLLYKYPSCTEGILKSSPKGKTTSLACTKAHKVTVTKKGVHKCSRCGQKLRHIAREYIEKADEENEEDVTKEVIFDAPVNTNVLTSMTAAVQNKDGFQYKYKLYYQKSKNLKFKYPKYRAYMKMHGCSTCALTTILNATVPKYKNYTPDQVLVEVIKPSVGSKAYKKNFSKSLRKQMPIGLKGINKVLKDNGVRCKYVYNYTKKSAAKEIKEHLSQGNPVIFMQPKSIFTPVTHAMLMIGLDENGRIIVGDSVHGRTARWGQKNKLVKYHTTKSKTSNKVEKVCKYFNASTTSVKGRSYFYDGRKGNIGYILVYKD